MSTLSRPPDTHRHAADPGTRALDLVGARIDEVVAAATTHGGEPYLVGSLAARLGDSWSDIDVHVVCAGAPPVSGPVFASTSEGTCVDIRYVRRSSIDRTLAGHDSRPPKGRAWTLSRWLNSVPLIEGAPPLLTDPERDRARTLLVTSLLADLVSLTSFATLAEHAGAPRAWYLCRRAGIAAWELAATLKGQDYLGERWLIARSSDPEVAAFAETAAPVQQTGELDLLLDRLGIPGTEAPGRVRLLPNPEAERWTLGGRPKALVAGRRLVPQIDPVPETVADAFKHCPAAAFAALADGALRWKVDVAGLTPRLGAA
ncbi:hypothetical protein [Streptomyces sp. NPDC050164]|uniref:hypothetical protein n=1 Tax=Streptomyces sp. NPDC050164 TaxID=3365605 RepID=UPI0037AEAB9D